MNYFLLTDKAYVFYFVKKRKIFYFLITITNKKIIDKKLKGYK